MTGSIIRYGQLRRVFRSDLGLDFDAHLVQLCVLYEDLRIELSALTARSMAVLDVLDPWSEHKGDKTRVGRYRRHYFLRRSFATIREFAECLAHMRKTPEYQAIRARIQPELAGILDNAIRFFSTNAEIIRTARNNTGGHVGLPAARFAVERVDAAVIGKLEFSVDGAKSNAKLHFAGELVATAFTRGLPGRTSQEKIESAVSRVADSYHHAARVVQVMIRVHIMDRFGR